MICHHQQLHLPKLAAGDFENHIYYIVVYTEDCPYSHIRFELELYAHHNEDKSPAGAVSTIHIVSEMA